MAQNAPFAVYARALKEARAYWPHIGLVLLLGLAWTPLALLTPLPLKLIVDNVLGDQPLPAYVAWAVPAGFGTGTEAVLALAIILSVMIALFGIVHTAADWLLREYVAERMVLDFRGRLFLHSLHTSLLSHFKRGSHEPAYRINLDAPALQWTALYGIVPVILALTSLGSMLYVTSLIAPRLALVALATAVPIILLIHMNQARMRNKWHGVREKESAAQSVVQEALGALRVVTVFGQEQREQQRYLGAARAGLRARLRVVQLEGVFSMGLGLATALGTTTILYLGVRDVQAGAIAVGDLLLIMGYIGQLYGPLQTIGNHITGQQRAIASAERAFGMLDEKPMVEERPGACALDEARGEIVFDDVTFAYPNTERPTLRNVKLRLPAGASVGIIGRSGAGKSTLINLLVRMFDPQQGRILLDGQDIRDLKIADLRRQFSMVSQEVVLFSTTVAENIAYAKPGATRAEIMEAARRADAHAFISRLPQGYDTPVGDSGMLMSGGERQRISLARAFLKDAPILLLDEPTSALDNQTEAAITECLERLVRGRTVLIIAHHQTVLREVDFLFRVDDGRVLEENRVPEIVPTLLKVTG
ncbi:MAG: ABC transporter ATP-binding protein/permease [Gammaproteobacteria bacterium]|nr:ABC transporter ATP-binding protein/permease [Gammaproteobacteria bacterium]